MSPDERARSGSLAGVRRGRRRLRPHPPAVRPHGRRWRRIVNAGAVGMPYEGRPGGVLGAARGRRADVQLRRDPDEVARYFEAHAWGRPRVAACQDQGRIVVPSTTSSRACGPGVQTIGGPSYGGQWRWRPGGDRGPRGGLPGGGAAAAGDASVRIGLEHEDQRRAARRRGGSRCAGPEGVVEPVAVASSSAPAEPEADRAVATVEAQRVGARLLGVLHPQQLEELLAARPAAGCASPDRRAPGRRRAPIRRPRGAARRRPGRLRGRRRGRARAGRERRYLEPATRAISAIDVTPRRTFSRPSSRRRIMPSRTASWAIASAVSRATAIWRIVSEIVMTS